MTNRNSVRDILYRAGAEGRVSAARRSFSSPAQGLSTILRHLENGVLPRRHRLDFDGGGCIEIDVAERQIVGLARVTAPTSGTAPDTRLEPGPLSPDNVKALGDLLSTFCRASRSVRISSSAADEVLHAGSGFSLAALRKAAALPDVVAKIAGRTTWLDAVVDSPEIDVMSAVLIDVDEAHVVIGTKEEAEALADWAVEMLDVFLADGFPLAAELETKGALTFAPQQNGSHILLAGLRGQFLLARVSGPDTSSTLAAWRRVAENEVDGFIAVG
jgi:hypothetical protein